MYFLLGQGVGKPAKSLEHGHSIFPWCWLVSHKDIEIFMWLFQTWLSCISNFAPIKIITDQDRAMKNIIEDAFANI